MSSYARADFGAAAAKVCKVRLAAIGATRSESQVSADSVEKQRAAGAEIAVSNWTRVPFLSGFARLLRCGKDLRQFA